ncbi:helix-turn-helix domain-containing protein [Streptomyces sp. NPDC001982]|uniref:helix-turn-helix domain-containing protein n=1 Tax=Streptomyces sp. NPDC001982 TaxID=3154405 RepID=UPI003320BB39
MDNAQNPPHLDGVRPRDAAGITAFAPRLRASWQRSRRYGVAPDHVRPVFTGSVDRESLLYECGREVLQSLRSTLANEPVSMMITGSDGLVLCRMSDDASVDRALDRVHLAPGFSFAERNVGTNGLGLALADRAPSLVRADEHYCSDLRGFTCAAVPVLDPVTSDLAGSVNLTTWSDASSSLLLALAQAAAGNTAALMLARGHGGRMSPSVPRGEVFRVQAGSLADQDLPELLSQRWTQALDRAHTAMLHGDVLAVVGEPGAGKTALACLARRAARPRVRLLGARPPSDTDVEPWLSLWSPELAKDDTCVVLETMDALTTRVATRLAEVLSAARRSVTPWTPPPLQPFVITAERYDALPEVLRAQVDAVVEAPALRLRPDDILPLADLFARRHRGRPITFTPAAARALCDHSWPDNARQLERVVREAASRTDTIDVHHLPAEVFTDTTRHLTRIEQLERDEIVRCLTEPATTMTRAAERLGMSRATIYRKIAHYGIRTPGRSSRGRE